MDCIASEKGDSVENHNPNAIIANIKPGKDDGASESEDGELKTKPDTLADLAQCSSESNEESEMCEIPEQVEFTLVFNKSKHTITFGFDASILDLKAHLERITGVPMSAQKLLIKGMARDDMTLRTAGVTQNGKVMLVGSKIDDILAVKSAPKEALEEKAGSQSTKEPLCMQKIHRKVLDKGIPPDAMPGLKGIKVTNSYILDNVVFSEYAVPKSEDMEPLPPHPISGMLNKHGGKVRLTFKKEQDQVWLGTKERTEKLAMTSIKSITSEPIKDHEEYHIMGLQLGPTEASRYWVYWVPAQYIEAINEAVFGAWQFF